MHSMGEERGTRTPSLAKPGCPSSPHRFAAGPFFSPLAQGEDRSRMVQQGIVMESALHHVAEDLAIDNRILALCLDLQFPYAGRKLDRR